MQRKEIGEDLKGFMCSSYSRNLCVDNGQSATRKGQPIVPLWQEAPSKLQGSEMPSSRPIMNKVCVERLFHSSYLLSQPDR
jgi:hypothetical protein